MTSTHAGSAAAEQQAFKDHMHTSRMIAVHIATLQGDYEEAIKGATSAIAHLILGAIKEHGESAEVTSRAVPDPSPRFALKMHAVGISANEPGFLDLMSEDIGPVDDAIVAAALDLLVEDAKVTLNVLLDDTLAKALEKARKSAPHASLISLTGPLHVWLTETMSTAQVAEVMAERMREVDLNT